MIQNTEIIRLVYDYFDGVGISLKSQAQRIENYRKNSMRAKYYIAVLVYFRILIKWDSYYDFFRFVKQISQPPEILDYLRYETKRGFFTKEVLFLDDKLIEKEGR